MAFQAVTAAEAKWTGLVWHNTSKNPCEGYSSQNALSKKEAVENYGKLN